MHARWSCRATFAFGRSRTKDFREVWIHNANELGKRLLQENITLFKTKPEFLEYFGIKKFHLTWKICHVLGLYHTTNNHFTFWKNNWNFLILYQSEMFDFQMRQKPVGDQSLSQKKSRVKRFFTRMKDG